jgi:hypothetical protein
MLEPLPGYWQENLRRMLHDWEGREKMIGLAVLVGTALGYGVLFDKPEIAKLGAVGAVAYLALLVLVLNPWRMWRDSQQTISDYRERLVPRLQFVFEPDVPPYLQHFPLRQPARVDQRVRMWRIGVRNVSADVVKRVRVVVESVAFIRDGQPVPASPDAPAPIEHALNVMGIDRKPGTFNVSPGDLPGMYVDVVEQMTAEGKNPDDWMSLCYASGHRVRILAKAKWVIGLRAEGGGTYCRARVTIEGSAEEPNIVMRLHGVG